MTRKKFRSELDPYESASHRMPVVPWCLTIFEDTHPHSPHTCIQDMRNDHKCKCVCGAIDGQSSK